MTLEQRVEALELAIANMTAQQNAAKEMREIATEVIKDVCRPGGVLNAAKNQAAIEVRKADGSTAVRLAKIL